MHVSSVEQDNVEEVYVLNHRLPEECLKHPRGGFECDVTCAVVSEYPCAVAASSHSAWLPTHAHPLLSVQRPDVRASNPFAAFANLLHVLIAATQYMPVVPAVSQSTLPHAQADGLAAEPSVVAQVEILRHLF